MVVDPLQRSTNRERECLYCAMALLGTIRHAIPNDGGTLPDVIALVAMTIAEDSRHCYSTLIGVIIASLSRDIDPFFLFLVVPSVSLFFLGTRK